LKTREKFFVFIRGYRAVEDANTNEEFIEGHTNVLRDINVEKVSSENTDWYSSTYSIVIVVRSETTKQLVAGTRLDISGGDIMLPIEKAIGDLDSKIYDMVKSLAPDGLGEICGLWTSKAVSGRGLASILIRSCIAIAPQLHLKSLFGLCSYGSINMLRKSGGVLEESLGNKGTFLYPTEEFIATVLRVPDVNTLENAEKDARRKILELRENPRLKTIEQSSKGELELEFDIKVH